MKRYIKAAEEISDLQRALDFINDYRYYEFDDEDPLTPSDNLSDIGLMYTTIDETDDDYTELQVSVDLVNFEMNYYVDAELVHRDRYSGLAEMNATVLSGLEFDELYSACISYGEDAGAIEPFDTRIW